jgi:hypothetical protein
MTKQHNDLTRQRFECAIAAFDAANAEDPNKEKVDGDDYPKELLYARRMSDMLSRYAPDASEALRLAVRCQHIQRWKIPRADFPLTRSGYHQWRQKLKVFHAELAASILREAGYEDATVSRVAALVQKALPLSDPEMQTLEDVVVLVFIEHYLEDFVAAHPEYDMPKLYDILRKTLRKISPQARHAALIKIRLPQPLVPAITAVMREEGWLA